jgi:hypothetical protein
MEIFAFDDHLFIPFKKEDECAEKIKFIGIVVLNENEIDLIKELKKVNCNE